VADSEGGEGVFAVLIERPLSARVLGVFLREGFRERAAEGKIVGETFILGLKEPVPTVPLEVRFLGSKFGKAADEER
jgi:hypothetical protein